MSSLYVPLRALPGCDSVIRTREQVVEAFVHKGGLRAEIRNDGSIAGGMAISPI